MELPSTKPYLLRAIWEWCCDNGFTPYIAVAVDERTRVPREFVRDGQIVLNVGAEATNKLQMGNDFIEFQARFGGVARELSVPIERVAAIYARENGAGMAFEIDGEKGASEQPGEEPAAIEAQTPPEEPPEPPRPEGGRPKLQRIK
ncbi:MAG TPA: ClpXP protease specificity-enhancing factor [Rhodocyclaceae bacterium]|nr:ClpXP protease specificity-enhancing factor [Rhodocyclaceae bacterium]